MEAISVNAPARHVRERLPSKDPKQADLDWSAFEVPPYHPYFHSPSLPTSELDISHHRQLNLDIQHTVKYLYETDQATLAPEITWNQLSTADKESAIDKVSKELEPLQLGWGQLLRPVVKWRLYHCHRKNRIKVMKGSSATEGASTSTPDDGTEDGGGTVGLKKGT